MMRSTLLLSALLLTSVEGFADQNDPIVFQDLTVKMICVDNWDTNDDGELSYAEAAAVKSLDGKFEQQFNIYMFNEFKYFTGITETRANEFASTGFLREITLPPNLRKLGNDTFYGSGIRKITFNDKLEEIGKSCFQECMNLSSVSLPETVVTIKEQAFAICQNIKEFRMPSKVKEIGPMTFFYCIKLNNIIFNEAIEKIHPNAFLECYALKKVHITKNINTAESAFTYCSNLQEFTVDSANPYFTAIDGCLYTKDGKALVAYTLGSPATEYKVYEGTTEIKSKAFGNADHLVKVILPENLTTIGKNAFQTCKNLQTVNLPEGVKQLKGATFRDCKNLKNVDLPSQLTSIDEIAFLKCSELEKISLPESLTSLGRDVFEGCTKMNEIRVYSKTGEIDHIAGSSLIYNEEDDKTNNRTVYVPYGCLETYKAHPYWKYAKEIKEMEMTAIDEVEADVTVTINGVEVPTSSNASIYTLDGILIKKFRTSDREIRLPVGVYILNGKKVVIR